MTSGRTSVYSTIQDVFEDPDAPKPSEIENGQETTGQQSCVSPDPSDRKEPEPSDNENGQETADPPVSSVQPSNEYPGPTDKKEEAENFQLRDIRLALIEDDRSDIRASPVPQPRTKMNIYTVGNPTGADDLTDDSASSDSTMPSPLQSTYVLATAPASPFHMLKKAEVKRSSSLPKPERPPPPVGYYGKRPSTPKSIMYSDKYNGQASSSSSEQQSPVSPGPSGEQMPLFGVYRSTNENSVKPAIPPRPPQPKQPYVSSASLTSVTRPPPPSFNPPPPPSDKEPLYNEIQYPAYLHILPEHDKHMTPEKQTKFNGRTSAQRSSMACTQEIFEMLRWLKVVSKTDYMTPSLYGVSLEEEIRTFHHTGMNLKKALRLFNLLMMKRSELLRDHISEFNSTSEAMDKALKRKKTIQVAGGTTGAVGGVTAVVGLALAPVTFGASLIATAVGAGMVASAGGVSAHVAKTKKKIITRDGIERLINDYIDKVKDIEHCLNFILSGMNEMRRYDMARLQRAGAQPDSLKIAHLTHSVFNNMDNVRKNSVTQAGGMSSERLLLGFAKELDYYFKERDEPKLRKSRKSRFSGRVRLLAENLQDELDYLNHMWELFN